MGSVCDHLRNSGAWSASSACDGVNTSQFSHIDVRALSTSATCSSNAPHSRRYWPLWMAAAHGCGLPTILLRKLHLVRNIKQCNMFLSRTLNVELALFYSSDGTCMVPTKTEVSLLDIAHADVYTNVVLLLLIRKCVLSAQIAKNPAQQTRLTEPRFQEIRNTAILVFDKTANLLNVTITRTQPHQNTISEKPETSKNHVQETTDFAALITENTETARLKMSATQEIDQTLVLRTLVNLFPEKPLTSRTPPLKSCEQHSRDPGNLVNPMYLNSEKKPRNQTQRHHTVCCVLQIKCARRH